MNRTLQPARTLFVIGLLGLGVLALVFHDFALDWQPIAPWVPGRTCLAYGSGVLMLACGAVVVPRDHRMGSPHPFPYLVLWTLLKVPLLFVSPGMEAVWLDFGEVVMLMNGGWVLWAVSEEVAPRSMLTSIAGNRGLQRALVAFGLALLPVGLSHLVYVPVKHNGKNRASMSDRSTGRTRPAGVQKNTEYTAAKVSASSTRGCIAGPWT
jgi:hypothetical protein